MIGTNVSYCFTHLGPGFNPCVETHETINGTSRTNNGVTCNSNWISSRSCEQYTTCTDCLATWPNNHYEISNVCTSNFNNIGNINNTNIYFCKVCSWCANCGTKGQCVKDSSSCDTQCKTVTKVEMCPNIQCMATDCEKCHQQDNCLWTRYTTDSPCSIY